MEIKIRNVEVDDYYKNHLSLYCQLTSIDPTKISYENYRNFILSLNDHHMIFVIEQDNCIIGSITLLIENKLIHNMGKVGHIEDVVVEREKRYHGIGKALVQYAMLYAKKIGCYKTILDCNQNICVFYEKCGLKLSGAMMSYYN
jgi:glucosamine-phosphate N-acetyltransferase